MIEGASNDLFAQDGVSESQQRVPSRGAELTISATSACVGFCPNARRRSPNNSLGTDPVPRLSKSAKASLYSTIKCKI
jgi:hypothetical protein